MAEPFKVTAVPPPHILYNPLVWLLWLLDFVVWVVTIIGPVQWIMTLIQKPAAHKVGDAWRLVSDDDKLVSFRNPECTTMHAMIQRSCATFADLPACGTRKYVGDYQAEGARFASKKFGETNWVNYKELGRMIKDFGAGLIKLGMAPAPDGVDLQQCDGPHTMLIFEETCTPWIVSMLGAFSQSIAVATSYATLGIGAVVDAVNETSARAIVCNIKDVKKIAEKTKGQCKSLKVIIYTTNYSTEKSLKGVSDDGGVKLLSFDDVIALGKDNVTPFSPPTPDHLAVIMYTSGSTGKPKGVMIKHKSMVASTSAVMNKFDTFELQEAKQRYVAYLPAAHILELTAEMSMLSLGNAIGFACPKTISSKGAVRVRPDGSMNTKPGYPYPPGAIQEYRPTVMAAVPKIWDILKKGVEDVVGKGSPLTQVLFQAAYSSRFLATMQNRETPLLRAVVFKKLVDMMGGHISLGLTGGGPISAGLHGFIRTAFCIELIQGYALTETTCAGSIQSRGDTSFGVVGPPFPSVEIKVRSCLDGNGDPECLDRKGRPYLASDRTHFGMPCCGRGEVLIRGPSVSSGYFKQPDKTAEVFDSDGWFRSGDVGVIREDGALMIVDRLKNLVKLKGGEYVAIEAMEREYSTSPYVNGVHGGIMCYGDGDMDRPVALVQVNTDELKKWAKNNEIKFKSLEELCKNPAAEKAVLDSMLAAGKAGDLAVNEMLVGVGLISGTGPMEGNATKDSPWTSENGGLTASNKLNRKPIQSVYASILEPLRKKAGA